VYEAADARYTADAKVIEGLRRVVAALVAAAVDRNAATEVNASACAIDDMAASKKRNAVDAEVIADLRRMVAGYAASEAQLAYAAMKEEINRAGDDMFLVPPGSRLKKTLSDQA
jgi:hypothetical protein